MDILIIQKLEEKPDYKFNVAPSLKRALNRMGINCILWDGESSLEEIKFDVILLMDKYGTKGLPDLSLINTPKIFWSMDVRDDLKSHLQTVEEYKINHVLSSSYVYCHNFIKDKQRYCSWFPHAYPSDLIDISFSEKTANVGFCGDAINQGEWIKFLVNEINLKQDSVIGMDMVNALKSYRIHWNRNIKDDIGRRTFETLGCGTFLLINETDRLTDIFTIGDHLVTYTSPNDCVEKIRYYLVNEKERESIAKAGQEYVKFWHTYDRRAEQLIYIINTRL